MRSRGIVLFVSTVALGACASSDYGTTDIRIVTDRESLAGCAKVGVLNIENARAWETAVPGGVTPAIRAQVTSLGGNVVLRNSVGRLAYDEVWSCPVETVVTPR